MASASSLLTASDPSELPHCASRHVNTCTWACIIFLLLRIHKFVKHSYAKCFEQGRHKDVTAVLPQSSIYSLVNLFGYKATSLQHAPHLVQGVSQQRLQRLPGEKLRASLHALLHGRQPITFFIIRSTAEEGRGRVRRQKHARQRRECVLVVRQAARPADPAVHLCQSATRLLQILQQLFDFCSAGHTR